MNVADSLSMSHCLHHEELRSGFRDQSGPPRWTPSSRHWALPHRFGDLPRITWPGATACLLTHSLVGLVHPAPSPPPPTITSFISCSDIIPPLPGPPQEMSTACNPEGGSVSGQGHTCVRPHSSLCLSLCPQPLPLALLLKWGAATADVGRVKVFGFLLTEARLVAFHILTACQTFGSLSSSHILKAVCLIAATFC